MKQVGTIQSLYRYPVKAMRAEPLKEATLRWTGVEGDRQYAFVKNDSLRTFPWFSARDVSELVLYTPRFANPEKIHESAVIVTTPDGRDLPVDSPDLLEMLTAGRRYSAHLMQLSRGCYDAMPVSLISTATLRQVGHWLDMELDPRRFRPNILLDLEEDVPFGEETWVGRGLVVGHEDSPVRLRVIRRNQRCAVPTIDPETGQRDPRVLKALTDRRDECAAVYAAVEQIGTIRPGDPIFLADG